MNIRQNLFGQSPRPSGGQRPIQQDDPRGGYGQQPPPPQQQYPRHQGEDPRQTGYDSPQRGGYGGASQQPPRGGGYGSPGAAMPQRTSVGRQQGPPGAYGSGGGGGGYGAPAGGERKSLRITKVEEKALATQYIFGNLCAVSPKDFPTPRDGRDLYLLLNDYFVVSAAPTDSFPSGYISLADKQRAWLQVGLQDQIKAEVYDPFEGGRKPNAYLGALDIDVGFASVNKFTDVPYDQDILADAFTKQFQNQILAPGQIILMDHKNIPLLFTVKTVQLTDMSMEKGSEGRTETAPTFRGILLPNTAITFYKDAKSPIKLKGSSKRPAANAIIAPNFKFEDMGIGGLDTEFGAIFRRAFASRIFPPGLIEKMGIQHVKGMLLYGPPGTGKTLIARQIGNMLNSRPPKVINGPEVLNKFVGQSEENIRKLFADAEKEYKEKGDESGLHIIIFDELDAVCKQRGSGAGGGTGVGDSVVNQLLSKLDGVDQLNNILLIGMTNRMDMIDDALLRPGRLEVHMEISLPDEHGRQQILKIHTAKLLKNGVLAPDVDLMELAHLSKNFSGAEIGGLVKSASSWAFQRHVKVGTVAGISDDIENIKVSRDDFMRALDEVRPAFGVSEEEIERAMEKGILHFSPHIQNILKDGSGYVDLLRTSSRESLFSILLHGPSRSGKTALAAKIAKDSTFPFIKMISAENMGGFSESAKIQYIHKVFADAYKSPLSIVVLDSIERIVEWSNVGPRFSNPLVQEIMSVLVKKPPQGRRLLVLGTTSQRSVLQQLDVHRLFKREIAVPNVSSLDQIAAILREEGVFDDEREIGNVVGMLRGREISAGIEMVLSYVEEAKVRASMEGENLGVVLGELLERNICI